MKNIFFIITILLLLTKSSLCQSNEKKVFGTKNIDHFGIAIQFMEKIKNGDYEYCYKLLSEEYKANINFEDFKFRMEMLHSLSGNEEFVHYNTTFIGATHRESIAIMRGQDVKENIMPEYDFTIKSELYNEFKSVQIFIRFENEDSDKIRVINYSKEKLINKEIGLSSTYSNPFIVGSYILVAEIEDDLYIDIRGGNLRDSLKQMLNNSENEVLIKIKFEEFVDLLSIFDLAKYSLIHVTEKSESKLTPQIRKLAYANGFSPFTPSSKEYISKTVNNSKNFKERYENRYWNPIGSSYAF